MKLMTLNTHSLAEADFESKREWFFQTVLREKPDILALQEINQTIKAPVLPENGLLLPGYRPCPRMSIPVRQDNHAAWLAKRLAEEGLPYEWSWLPMKVGYSKYDEGMAIFSRAPIEEVEQLRISQADDYSYWKTRKILGIKVNAPHPAWYYCIHMGWWDDADEPFENQWKILNEHIESKKTEDTQIWLLGDFNSPSGVRGEGYDLIRRDGWQDSYLLAEEKDDGITVGEIIDGWRERLDPEDAQDGMRMDHLFCSRPVNVLSSRTVFNGAAEPQVSDHYGVLIETESPYR